MCEITKRQNKYEAKHSVIKVYSYYIGILGQKIIHIT